MTSLKNKGVKVPLPSAQRAVGATIGSIALSMLRVVLMVVSCDVKWSEKRERPPG